MCEAAEPSEALPEEMPVRILAEQHRTESVGVANDGVGAEVTEVLRQLAGITARNRPRLERRAHAGASLVEQEHPVAGEQLLQPRPP